jgi:hypothetical protein
VEKVETGETTSVAAVHRNVAETPHKVKPCDVVECLNRHPAQAAVILI